MQNFEPMTIIFRIADIERGDQEGGRRRSSSSSDSLKSFSSTRGSINKVALQYQGQHQQGSSPVPGAAPTRYLSSTRGSINKVALQYQGQH